MYSWLGEYWKEALAYIVILAYFLLKAALATEVTEDYFLRLFRSDHYVKDTSFFGDFWITLLST